MIVRGSRLASEVGICCFVVTYESHQSGACAAHAALKQLLHEEGRTIGNDLLGLRRCFVDHIAIAILNLCNEHRIYLLAVVHRCAIGIHHFEQIYIAGTKGERRGGVELRLDTHVVGCVDDILDAALLPQTDGYGVDTHGEGLLQRDVNTREMTVGIGWCPSHFLAMIHHLHSEVFILACVARGNALIHGLRIDEELEC